MDHALVPKNTTHALDPTFTDVAGQIAPSSARIYTIDARRFASWITQQGLDPATLTRSDMIAYRAYLQETISPHTGKPYSRAARQRMFSVAMRLMREHYASGRGSVDVTHEVKGFKTSGNETTHVALSKRQALQMLEDIDQSTTKGKRDYAILLLLLKSGLRRAELVALNRGSLTMRDGHHVALVEHGKGDKTRVVKIRVDVSRAITAYLEDLGEGSDTNPLFVHVIRGDHPTQDRLSDKGIERLVKSVTLEGVKGLTPHGLRATFATIALEEGAPLQQVQYAMGHSDPRTTERYQKRKVNLDHNAVDYLNF